MVSLQSVPNLSDDAVQRFICSQWIVVRENNMFHFSVLCQFDYEFNRAVTPSCFGRIFCSRVLRVVNQKVRTFDEGAVLLIRSKILSAPFGYIPGKRLVIAAIHNRRTVSLQPIS